MKRTTVPMGEAADQCERAGFVPVDCYAAIRPEPHELGGIFKPLGAPRLDRTCGIWVQSAECVERIFLAEDAEG